RDVARVDAALLGALGPGRQVALTADLGPAERYRRWLRVLRGEVRAVVGTRAAMFAPVVDLGLAVVWDDGDDLHAEPHAPYPHVREVLALRAHAAGSGLLLAGLAQTSEGAQLVATGWVRSLAAPRDVVRQSAPRVRPADDDTELARDEAAHVARLPTLAWQTVRMALRTGPVLVQVPRAGYLPSVACARCRAAARCPHCAGPLALTSGHAIAHCRWCGRPAGRWRCAVCGGTGLRARVVGARRTAEELARAFPAVPVLTSGGAAVLATVGPKPAVVVATPGAEPVAADGYAAALLLDGWALLDRPDLRAGEEALRRWMNAAALVRPATAGGDVVVLAGGDQPPVQALLRWDPVWYAERELAERAELGFPPAARWAAVTGAAAGVEDFLTVLRSVGLPAHAQVLGPVPVSPVVVPARVAQPETRAPAADVRALVRVPLAEATALSTALRTTQGLRTARKAADPVRIRIDPMELG
ncbi:MAG: primosome assembly protein PriA, partial [Acidothermales bacterium]|nr:primosome assembly protein PriA [Acidothermales bacterium]